MQSSRRLSQYLGSLLQAFLIIVQIQHYLKPEPSKDAGSVLELFAPGVCPVCTLARFIHKCSLHTMHASELTLIRTPEMWHPCIQATLKRPN